MPKETFVVNLKILMERKGMTQATLAKQLGVHKSTPSHWIRTKTYPGTIDLLLKLCDVLEVQSVDHLIRIKSK